MELLNSFKVIKPIQDYLYRKSATNVPKEKFSGINNLAHEGIIKRVISKICQVSNYLLLRF
jgi:predicted transcriptional regulator